MADYNTPQQLNQGDFVKQAQSSIASVVNQYIVRPTGGTNTTGINGFVFDILGDETFAMESQITDHYAEDNISIQDHIALGPIKVMLKGYIGELSDLFETSLLNVLTNVQSLSSIGGYAPTFTAQATQVYNQIQGDVSQVSTVINQAQNLYQIFSGTSTTATKQSNAYLFFLNTWMNRESCSVETPWSVLPNMYIEKVEIQQKDENMLVSEFSVTFKQIRTTNTVTEPVQTQAQQAVQGQQVSPVFIDRSAGMNSATLNLGQVAGSSTDSAGNLFGISTLKTYYP